MKFHENPSRGGSAFLRRRMTTLIAALLMRIKITAMVLLKARIKTFTNRLYFTPQCSLGCHPLQNRKITNHTKNALLPSFWASLTRATCPTHLIL